MSSTPTTREELEVAVQRGESFDFLYFWGHTPKRDGPGKWVFSQWWEGHPFEVDGERYLTAEHFMMAEKARVMGDLETRAAVLAAKTPGEAKKLGRRVTPWDEEKWTAARFDVVVRGNEAKFGQHEALMGYLRSTTGKVLVEASPHDRIWGIGLRETDAAARDPRSWAGLNLLGFALGVVRDRRGG
jgi:ribA/ribD-fused uncharacterized protein